MTAMHKQVVARRYIRSIIARSQPREQEVRQTAGKNRRLLETGQVAGAGNHAQRRSRDRAMHRFGLGGRGDLVVLADDDDRRAGDARQAASSRAGSSSANGLVDRVERIVVHRNVPSACRRC